MKTRSIALVLTISTAAVLANCGKKVDLSGLNNTPNGPLSPDQNPNGSCGPNQRVKWTFIQPSPPDKSSIDILLVSDTSTSMDDKRTRLAAAIPTFISKIPAGLDYQVAVMLGHGGSSPYSGKLYSTASSPAVLSSKKLT